MITASQVAFAGQSARLVYSRTSEASGCAEEAGLRSAVARRLGYDPFVAASTNTVVAELRGDGDGLKARVYVIRDANMAGGARELSSPTRNCTELMAAVALALSIAIDPDALDRVEPPAPASIPADAPEPANNATDPSSTEAERPPEPRDEPRAAVTPKKPDDTPAEAPAVQVPTAAPSTGGTDSRNSLQGKFGAFGFAATGPSPAPSWGFGLSAGLVLNRHWVASIEPEWLPKASKASDTVASVGIRMSGIGGAVHLGYALGDAYGGALFELQRLTTEGYGIFDAKTDTSWWPSAGLRVGYAVHLVSILSLVPHLDALAGLKRLTFRMDGVNIHETPLAVARLGLGLEGRL